MVPKFSPSPFIVISVLLVVLSTSSCIGSVKKSAPGPGGLPGGVVQQGQPPAADANWPLYAGATRVANDFYTTTDPIGTVRAYYSDLLKIEPVARDEAKVVLTYFAPEYTVVLVPLTPSGTEIHFSPPAVASSGSQSTQQPEQSGEGEQSGAGGQ
jgi:hypothetical protein